MRKTQIASLLLRKHAGMIEDAARVAYAAGKGFMGTGKDISRTMAEHGVRSPAAHLAARALPYAVVAYGGKKAYESDPAQRLRYKYHMYKQRKAMERARGM